ncbi:MAG: hypothetical protein SFU99_18675 [Saprospiraceae bacterium]|nr:hypothetical protein [Saprospiraceae bacterium]
MKTVALIFVFFLISTMLFAQVDSLILLDLNQTRIETTRIHAYVLGGWALANITIGGYLTYKLEDGEPESFHHMNAAWNLVNLGVAWAILHNANHADITTYDIATSIHKNYQAQKLMMLNLGLDVSYTLGGLLLYEHHRVNKKFDYVLRGFGKSLMFQGIFLLALDTTFYTVYSSQNDEWRELFKSIMISPNEVGMVIRF